MPIAAAGVAQPVQLYPWPGNGLAEKVSLNPLAAFGLSATTRRSSYLCSDERFPRQSVIRIVDPHAVVLVRENYI